MADLNSGDVFLDFGPTSLAGGVGPFRISVRTDGDLVGEAKPEVGYLHRGIEKIAERTSWAGFVPYTDRIDYLAPIHCNLAYALAVERLCGISAPPRAQAIRIIVSELSRIASHLYSIAQLSQLCGLQTAMMYALRDREKVNDLYELLCGARLTFSYVRIGGVSLDITEGFVERVNEFLKFILSRQREYGDLLFGNPILKGRLAALAVLPAAKAIEHGITGPALRATGIKHDIRKNRPYCGYEGVEFDIPVGVGLIGARGDAFDRYFVRFQEIEQSSLIVKRAMETLPSGEFCIPQPRILRVPKGEAFEIVESPRGMFGVYIRSTGERKPSRVHFRSPSFSMIGLFSFLFSQVPLSELLLAVGSLDFQASEVDR